jgi:glycosyltransferase involved in cell wall biosynthesis
MDANTLSLVYIIGTYPGLTTTFIDREIQAIRAQGVRARVISIRRPRTPLSHSQESLQEITTYLLPVAWMRFLLSHIRFALRKPFAYFGALFKLTLSPHPDPASRFKTLLHFAEGVYAAEVISDQPCNHLHAHFVDRAATVAFVASRLLNVPYSLTAHANDIYIKPALLPLKFSQAQFVATCTDYNRAYIEEMVPLNGRLHCLYHGLDLESFQPNPIPSEIPLITSVGQLKEKKGFQYLLNACQILDQRGCTFQCQIIGDGPLRADLERQIRDLSLASRVTLRGALPHEAVLHEYQRSTLFVLPCVIGTDGDRDGIPNVILEALALQLPVVSTRHSGIPEALTDEVNGLLVPPADASALANAIARLLDDPDLRARLGRRGREIVTERFDVKRNAARLLAEMVKA